MKYEYQFFIYILASKTGTLYVGITNDLFRRLEEHCSGKGGFFTSRYGCCRLVYYEIETYADCAIQREKELKGWSRKKKMALIAEYNPMWRDLSNEISASY